MASLPLELEDVDLDFAGTPIQGPAGPAGPQGPAGNDGKDGTNGQNGINGINGQDGRDGRDGANGADGKDGVDGHDGIDGEDGLTAYELWLEAGNAGTVMDFLASLVGPKGDKGDTGAASTVPGPKGDPGIQGIQGPKGDTGNDGQDGTDGADGWSAYQVAVANGFVGTEAQWLASLKGAKGDTGTQGIQGVKGDKGDKGEAGTGLNNKGDWVAATYQPGDYVFAAGTTASTSMWILRGTAAYASASEPNTDLAHWIEFEAPAGQDGADGTDGTNGREVELSNDGTNIRWRYVSDTTWNILISVAAITGPKGDAGAKGDKGDTGNAGAAGTNGKTILSGTVIPDGTVGTDGDFYLNRTTNLFYGPKAAGAWPAGFSIVGAKGDKGDAGTAGTNGTNGNTVLTVSGTPAAGTGANGDYAYDPATWTFYGPKSAGAWPAGVVLKGTNGTAGKGVSSAVVTYQAHTSGTTAPTGTWSSTVPTVAKGAYLWTRTVTTYTDSTSTTAYSVAYQGADGTGGGSSVTLATTEEAKAAASATIATTPAGVREYMEQFGLTATYTTAPADLNSIVKGGFFNWGDTTGHAPIAGSYGRGICIPSGDGYVTQLSIENTTGKMHVRYQEGGTWTAWIAVSGGSSLPDLTGNAGKVLAVNAGATGLVWTTPASGGGSLPTGGTAGQVLTKNSATDGDASWATPASGGGGGTTIISAVQTAQQKDITSASAYTALGLTSAGMTTAILYDVSIQLILQGTAGATMLLRLKDIGANLCRLRATFKKADGTMGINEITQSSNSLTVELGASVENLIDIRGQLAFSYAATTGMDIEAQLGAAGWGASQKGTCYRFIPLGAMPA